MKTRNETTSRKSATAAGKILANTKDVPGEFEIVAIHPSLLLGLEEFLSCIGAYVPDDMDTFSLCTVDELQSAVASDLVQRVKGKK